MDSKSFIAKIKDGAISAMKKYNVLASVSIAQAILESGWGTHAPGNNLFGIKANNGWKGNTQILDTTEYENGKTVHIKDVFRAYDSWAASIEDHGLFLASSSRYKNIIGCKDAAKVCQYLQADGYATEQDYATQLIGLIKQYALTQYDATPKPAPAPKPAVHTETLKSGTWNVRSKASTSGAVLGTLRGGQKLTTKIVLGNWRQITFKGKTAYIGPAAF